MTGDARPGSRLAPLAAAFVSGAAAMAVEILSARRLAPAFGSTISTWSMLIAATLLAGAVGALVGGRGARSASSRRIAALLLAGAFATVLDAALGRRVVDALRPLPLDAGAALASVALVGPAVLAFAAVLPQALNGGWAASEAEKLGLTQSFRFGTTIAASTLGSLVGTLGAALGLLPSIGLDSSLHAVAALAALTALALGGRATRVASVVLLAGIGAAVFFGGRLWVAGAAGAEGGRVVFERESPYGVVTLERRPAGVVLLVDGIAQGTRSPFDAGLEALLDRGQHVAALPILHPTATRALVVGLGSGLVTEAFAERGLDVTTVEVNPVLVDVVRERWGLRGAVVLGDGRASLRRLAGAFDLAVLDAFQGESPPSHLLTREAFEELRSHLAPGAIVCVHLVGDAGHRVTGAVAATLRAAFPHGLALRGRRGAAVEDLFLLASDKPLTLPPDPRIEKARASVFEPAAGPVLTDDASPLDRWNEPLARRLRESSR